MLYGRNLFSRWMLLGLEEYFSVLRVWSETSSGLQLMAVESTNYQLIHQTNHSTSILSTMKSGSLREILPLLFPVIDPSVAWVKQGMMVTPCIGQGIYYTTADKTVIEQVVAEQEKQLGQKIAVELEPCAAIMF